MIEYLSKKNNLNIKICKYIIILSCRTDCNFIFGGTGRVRGIIIALEYIRIPKRIRTWPYQGNRRLKSGFVNGIRVGTAEGRVDKAPGRFRASYGIVKIPSWLGKKNIHSFHYLPTQAWKVERGEAHNIMTIWGRMPYVEGYRRNKVTRVNFVKDIDARLKGFPYGEATGHANLVIRPYFKEGFVKDSSFRISWRQREEALLILTFFTAWEQDWPSMTRRVQTPAPRRGMGRPR